MMEAITPGRAAPSAGGVPSYVHIYVRTRAPTWRKKANIPSRAVCSRILVHSGIRGSQLGGMAGCQAGGRCAGELCEENL